MSHWYSSDGALLDKVEYSDPRRKGLYRDATLRDARPLGLYPSVTTILQVLSKPALTRWQVMQGIKVSVEWLTDKAYNLGPALSYTEEELPDALFKASEEFTHWTQDFGTATHWWLNHKLRERARKSVWGIPPIMPFTEELADAALSYLDANGFEFTHTERTVVDPAKGYAGTIDLLGTHYDEPCLVDLKTQDAPLTAYDPEHVLQLVAYDELLGPPPEPFDPVFDMYTPDGQRSLYSMQFEPRKLISLIADRTNIGEFKLHEWTDIDRYRSMWQLLVEYWMLANKYDPREANT